MYTFYLHFQGVTGREMCHYFFAPEVRYDWEPTVETMKVVEVVETSKTLVFHQIHKRVWPAAQRDALFWSHIEQMAGEGVEAEQVEQFGEPLGPPVSGDLFNTWMVCNKSCDQPEIPVSDNVVSNVRKEQGSTELCMYLIS